MSLFRLRNASCVCLRARGVCLFRLIFLHTHFRARRFFMDAFNFAHLVYEVHIVCSTVEWDIDMKQQRCMFHVVRNSICSIHFWSPYTIIVANNRYTLFDRTVFYVGSLKHIYAQKRVHMDFWCRRYGGSPYLGRSRKKIMLPNPPRQVGSSEYNIHYFGGKNLSKMI